MNDLLHNFFDWQLIGDVLPDLLTYGLRNTLILSVLSALLGSVIGMVLAIMSLSSRPWLRAPARVYTDIFRGMPAALTILMIGEGVFSAQISWLASPYPVAILALSLMSGAYIGEIFRSGIQSVEKGQGEACRALGMTHGQAMRLVVVPQGVRRVLPAMVNQFIAIIKDSSLVYFLGLITSQRELFRIGQDDSVATGNLSPLLATGLCYLLLTVPLTHLVNYIDRRLRDGSRRPAATPEEPSLVDPKEVLV
ncbi:MULTISPECIES: amino acid ABC transporter permease [Streptomyces]|uniref:Polar amino acid ABC transporter, inner membrane subunit n=2 Tax=Streptomyces TaxID=1883 RepID=A0A1R1SE06_9ACTN|nr:amino acid ABC transporter permease [Streptomyces sparsogenes]OMI36604.1 polar amino acid ABC transporter, inner membrane subunit [Streptomyces sparsogenes DSM 40356]